MNPITLRTAAGASARIAAHLGFNCYEFKAVVAGQTTDVLWAAPGFGVDPEQRPSGSGIPLLFPFPGRIRGTSYTWHGKTYPLEAADGRGNAIHGFVYTRSWRVTEQSETRVVGQFQASVDDPSLLERWPSDFRITATYELSDDRLTLTLTFENPGDAPLPFGFGAHPYFRLPLGGNDAGECRVQVPVRDHWPLQNMVPTGQCVASDEAASLRQGIAFRDATFDDVFSGLERSGTKYESSIVDPAAKRTLKLRFDELNTACVVYTPAHREAICVEPYTCLPDPFYLESRGVSSGLKILQPNESLTTRVEIAVIADA